MMMRQGEAAGEVDKENQHPSDCPADDCVDIKPQSKKHTIPHDGHCWLKRHFISPNTDFYLVQISLKMSLSYAASVMFVMFFRGKELVFGTIIANQHG